jgi:xylulokinase
VSGPGVTGPGVSAGVLVGIDIGTQSIRALLADTHGRTLACVGRPTPTIVRGLGQAEYDPDALWRSVLEALRELAGHVPAGAEVLGIACASMGEACVLADAAGRPVAHAITWFDRRTESVTAALEENLGQQRAFRIAGIPIDPTLTLPKLLWHRQTDPAGFARARKMLNVADWIAFRLCGEAATDPSLASRTLCLDMAARDWSAEILSVAGIDRALLPPIRPSGTRLGPVREDVLAETGLPGRPVVGVGGHDHVCGGFAAGAGRPGVLLDSMGTAEALLLTVARPVLTEANRHLGFFQGIVGLHRPFAYFGTGINSSGGTIEWLRTLLGGAEHPARDALIAEAAAVPPGARGTAFLPHLAYGTPPHADRASRGAFLGLTTGTSRGAMFRAVLEGLALEARLVVDAMAAQPGAGRPEEIRLIGGNTRNPLLLRIKAAAYGRALTVIGEAEATALGAALLGGLAAGVWPDLDAAQGAIVQQRHVVEPDAAWVARYAELFEAVHSRLYAATAPLHHALSAFDAAQPG